jgi:hypothetical protein
MKKRMILVRLKLLFITSLFVSELFGQHYDFVEILPSQGIVYNNDSILLNKITVNELHQKLGIRDTSDPDIFSISMWDGFDSETMERVSGSEYVRTVEFKSIAFEFADKTDKDNLKLKWIRIREDMSLKICTDNGLIMGMINPHLKEFFPKLGKQDYVSQNGLTYNLYSYGISLCLEKMKNEDLRIIEISVHYKLE